MTPLALDFIQRISKRHVVGSVILILVMIAPYNKKLRYHIRNAICVFCMGLMSIWGIIISIVYRLCGKWKDSQHLIAISYYLLVSNVTGIRTKVYNKEYLKTSPAIFICNHQSWMDILMIGQVFPNSCVIMSKKSLKYSPLLGQFMSLSGTVFVDRFNRKNALDAFKSAAAQVNKHKLSVFIFPEGTRSAFDKPDLLPFKKGAFHLAIQAKIPIVPLCVENYSKVYSHKNFNFDKGSIRIKVLEPISTDGYNAENVDDLVNLARNKMLAEIKSFPDHLGVLIKNSNLPHEYVVNSNYVEKKDN